MGNAPSQPLLWIVAGPNGSGKSTLVSREDVREILGADLRLLNPDQLAARCRERCRIFDLATWPLLRLLPTDAKAALSYPLLQVTNLLSVRHIDAAVNQAIEERQSILVETVLSTDKYVSKVGRAHQLGYRVGLLFVSLPIPEQNLTRVQDRVKMGGHNVPAAKVRARWERAHRHLKIIAPLVDELLVFSNAPAKPDPPVLVAQKSGLNSQVILHDAKALPRVTKVFS